MSFLSQKKQYALISALFGSITIIWALKTIYFVFELGLSPHKKFILLSSAGFSFLITAIYFSGKSKLSTMLAFTIYLLCSILLYADVIYERYYDAILHIDLIQQANQLGDVAGAILSLMLPSDILYWIDLPILFMIFMFIFKKSHIYLTPFKALLIFGIGVAMITFTAIVPLKSTFTDQYKVALTGIISTHIFDITNSLQDKASAKEHTKKLYEELKDLQNEFSKKYNVQEQDIQFGKYKGKNLIIVQAESLNTFPIGMQVNGQPITPNLDKLIEKSDYFPNTYLQIGRGNTSDAEFVTNNSIYPMAPKGIYTTYPTNDFLSLPNLLKKEGYITSATHGNSPDFWNRQEAYIKQGFEHFYHIDHPEIDNSEIIGMGISDESIFKQMAEIYSDYNRPFYNFIVTLSNHRPFELPKEYQYLTLPEEFENTTIGNYLQSVHYFDKTIGIFIEKLKEKKLWDNTIFILYGDHYGPVPKDAEEIKSLVGVTFNEKERFRVPLIVHLPGQENGSINQMTVSQMDIYPTVSHLLGIKGPLIQMGESLYLRQEGFAGFAYETTRYTFYSDDYDYIASHDGVFESGICIDNRTGKPTNIEACRKGYEKLYHDIQTSISILENNMIKGFLHLD